jgi:membrane associated rhomboid family serine protease
MNNLSDTLKYNWKNSGILLQLILINVIIFIPLNISHAFNGSLHEYFALKLNFSELILKPWTLITCLFSHEQLGHIFSNMILLYMMGRIFLVVTGFTHWSKLTFIYLMGGLAGNFMLLISYWLFPQFFSSVEALGASAGVLAITLTVGIFCPEYVVHLIFLGEVKLKWVVAVLFLLSTFIDFQVNTGGKISHFGGAIFGAIYGYQLKKGNDISSWFTNIFNNLKSKPKLKVVHHQKKQTSQYNNSETENEKTLNRLLDKINRSGYEGLSKEEKETLHQLSRKK